MWVAIPNFQKCTDSRHVIGASCAGSSHKDRGSRVWNWRYDFPPPKHQREPRFRTLRMRLFLEGDRGCQGLSISTVTGAQGLRIAAGQPVIHHSA